MPCGALSRAIGRLPPRRTAAVREAELASFLRDLNMPDQELVLWPGGLRLEVRAYITPAHPPRELVSSVRAVVVSAGQILVVRDPTSVHILPGGRIESGETEVVALNREVGEETGWTITGLTYIGFLHYYLLEPRPAEYASLDSDFLQAVYGALAAQFLPELKEPSGYELDAHFESLETVRATRLTRREHRFLNEALRRLGYA